MTPLDSFLGFFCNIYVITSPSFVFENENITLENIWFHKIYIHIETPLLKIGMFKIKNN